MKPEVDNAYKLLVAQWKQLRLTFNESQQGAQALDTILKELQEKQPEEEETKPKNKDAK